MQNKFILISTQRTGSSWVADMLHSHPEIKMYEELFLSDYKEKPSIIGAKDISTWNAYWAKKRPFSTLIRPYYSFRYLQLVYAKEDLNKFSIGFKLMYNQLRRHPSILFYLLLNNVYVVHLIRRNHLDVIISKATKRERGGIAHSKNQVERVQVCLDTGDLLHRLSWQERKVKWAQYLLSKLPLHYMEVFYDDLYSGQGGFADILRFLNVSPVDVNLHSSLTKMNKGTHADIIKNYSSVKEKLVKSKYANLL